MALYALLAQSAPPWTVGGEEAFEAARAGGEYTVSFPQSGALTVILGESAIDGYLWVMFERVFSSWI